MTDAVAESAKPKEKSKKEKNQRLEGILELGRNWALAVAIAGAGIAASKAEIVDSSGEWQKVVFLTCTFASLIWIALAVLRFDDVLTLESMAPRSHWISFALILTLLPLGGVIVYGVARFSDNAAIVKICESVPDTVESKIHEYDECVRLKKKRDALRAKLEGNTQTTHATGDPAERPR
ncbi:MULTISPECIES: hypothetical protein [Xanthomonas]|uniref:hypothetical protein n=1 Tax=Xanthomonas TaxID=338 RepID=UPI000E1EC8A7|nr:MULTISPECIES: hypothetical protein [Xanthomonas]